MFGFGVKKSCGRVIQLRDGGRSEEAGKHGSSMQYYSGNRERRERQARREQTTAGAGTAGDGWQRARQGNKKEETSAGRRRSRNEEGREAEKEKRREDQTQQREPAKLSEAFTASPFSSPLSVPWISCMAARHIADPLPLSSVPFHAVAIFFLARTGNIWLIRAH